MQLNIAGMKFKKEELQKVDLRDIQANTVSRSHLIYMIPNTGKLILLLRAGEFVEKAFITKYLDKGLEYIYQIEVCAHEEIKFYQEKLRLLKNCKSQKRQRQVAQNLIDSFAEDFWRLTDKSYLCFVIACFDELYQQPLHVIDRLQSVSLVLYSRSLLISSIAVINSLINDYTDYLFIQDLYNTAFIMDFSLVEYSSYHYTTAIACEHERKKPGNGIKFLRKKNRPQSEKSLFLNHPLLSYEFAQTQINRFSNPEITMLIKSHHEKVDGSGFPYGLHQGVLTRSERLLTFCDYMIPFAEHNFEKGDGFKIINEYFYSLDLIPLANLLPIKQIKEFWELKLDQFQTTEGVDLEEAAI